LHISSSYFLFQIVFLNQLYFKQKSQLTTHLPTTGEARQVGSKYFSKFNRLFIAIPKTRFKSSKQNQSKIDDANLNQTKPNATKRNQTVFSDQISN